MKGELALTADVERGCAAQHAGRDEWDDFMLVATRFLRQKSLPIDRPEQPWRRNI